MTVKRLERLRVLLIGAPESSGFTGGGGREAALAWRIDGSPSVSELYCPTSNPFIRLLPKWQGPDEPFADCASLLVFCQKTGIDLVVIGPERPLADGLADKLRAAGIRTFGPSEAAAQIEASKIHAKWLMERAGVPTASYVRFNNFATAAVYARSPLLRLPCVIKADGLADGKGAYVCWTLEQVLFALEVCLVQQKFGSAGAEVIIEDFLNPWPGIHAELSVTVFVNARGEYLMAPFTQDHKAVNDGNQGPNTGGMGVIGPVPWVTREMQVLVEHRIVKPVVNQLMVFGFAFTGILYFGLMWTPEGPKVVEINCRLGDPEGQVVLMLWPDEVDFAELLFAITDADQQSIKGIEIPWKDGAAVCTVMTAAGYPGNYQKGAVISGGVDLEPISVGNEQTICFPAGMKFNDQGRLVVNGGRVLGVTTYRPRTGSLITTLEIAAQHSIARASSIHWKDDFGVAHFRTDIGRNVPAQLPAL